MKGMSGTLSRRKKQPGDDNATSEMAKQAVLAEIRKCFPEPEFTVLDGDSGEPRNIGKGFFGEITSTLKSGKVSTRKYGPEWDVVVKHSSSERLMLFEVKYQKDAGNAHERAYRNFTERTVSTLGEFLEVSYHPVKAIFTGPMAASEKYIRELKATLAPTQYFMYTARNQSEFLDWLTVNVKPYLTEETK